MSGLTQLGAAAGAVLAILALIGLVVRAARRAWSRIGDFLDDWQGEPPRPGVRGRPGVMTRLETMETRLARVEGQVTPNGGSSMHDKVTAIAEATGAEPG